jgi:hypothetical protein
LRLPFLFMAMLGLAGCGGEASESAPSADAGVTLKLPPALPAEEAAPPAAAAEETVAVEDPPAEAPAAGEARLVPASPPIAQASLARYIDRSGFECDEVVTVTQLVRADGSRAGIYKFDCRAGGDYQGTMRNNHLYFRPWEGIPG